MAARLKDYLSRHDEIRIRCTVGGTCRFLTTESEDKFRESATVFLQQQVEVSRVVLE